VQIVVVAVEQEAAWVVGAMAVVVVEVVALVAVEEEEMALHMLAEVMADVEEVDEVVDPEVVVAAVDSIKVKTHNFTLY